MKKAASTFGFGEAWAASGIQETWLTPGLQGIFEMALYPNLCVDYIGQFAPGLVAGHRGLILDGNDRDLHGLNILGAVPVGEGSVDERGAALCRSLR